MRSLAAALKKLILANDPRVKASPGKLMGDSGTLFHDSAQFVYAITTGKSRVTLHALPMYCKPRIRQKYLGRIGGDFAKGCIRFRTDAEIDVKAVAALIKECAKVKFPPRVSSVARKPR